MNYRDALDAAPPTPACFPDRETWASYLLACQEGGKRATDRPFTEAHIFRPIWNFCCDCTAGHAKAMSMVGRCKPSQFRVKVAPQVETLPLGTDS